MSRFVLDASVALAWCFEDEADPAADALLRTLGPRTALVPGLWALEVTNVLIGAERRGRITPAETARFLRLLDELPIDVDAETPARAGREGLLLARAHGLSSYDAAYLELAVRRGVPLATRDRALAEAARSVGVEVWVAGGSLSAEAVDAGPQDGRADAEALDALWAAPGRSGGRRMRREDVERGE